MGNRVLRFLREPLSRGAVVATEVATSVATIGSTAFKT
jgi:hypothetical protein